MYNTNPPNLESSLKCKIVYHLKTNENNLMLKNHINLEFKKK